MGFYTQHILKIKSVHSVHDLAKIANAINDISGYRFTVYTELDCIDDRNWNGGMGSKFYECDTTLEKVSSMFPNIEFICDCCSEENCQYTIECYNGEINYVYHSKYSKEAECYIKDDDYPIIDYDFSYGEYPQSYEDKFDCKFAENGNYIINPNIK